MATLATKFVWDIEGKAETGGIPEIITAGEIHFKPNDYTLNSTSIIFKVDGAEVSRFNLLEDYSIFFEERPLPISDVSNVSFQDTVTDLNIWVDAIQGFLNLPMSPQANFKVEIEKDDDEITSKFTLKAGDILLLDAKWKKEDDTLSFGARVEATIPWPDFLRYIGAVNKFVKEVNFAKLT